MRVKHILPFGEFFYGKRSGAIGIFLKKICETNLESYLAYEIFRPDFRFHWLVKLPLIRRYFRNLYYCNAYKTIKVGQLIVIHNDIPMLLFFLERGLKNPIILHLHNEYDLKQLNTRREISGIVVCSRALKAFVIKQKLNIPVTVIGNGACFVEDQAKIACLRKYSLGFVGRLDFNKGFLNIMKALKNSQKEFIIVVAKTPLSLETLYVFSKLIILYLKCPRRCNVKFNLHHRQVIDLLLETKILIVPTQKTEAFGMVALEAISCGAFALTTKVGGLPDVDIHSGKFFQNGFLLEEKVNQLLKDHAMLAKLRDSQYSHATRYSWDKIAKNYYVYLSSPKNAI